MTDKEMYDLELERAASQINKQRAKLVCIQLPDGLKPMAGRIADSLSNDTGAEIVIWLGSCFGACDMPTELEKLDFDLLIQWGHSKLAE